MSSNPTTGTKTGTRKKPGTTNKKLKDKALTKVAGASTKENVPVLPSRSQPARSKQTSRWQEVIEAEMNEPTPTKGKKRKADITPDVPDEALNRVPPSTSVNPMAPAAKRPRPTHKKPPSTPLDPSLMGAPMPSLGPSSTMTYGVDPGYQNAFAFRPPSTPSVAPAGFITNSAMGQQVSPFATTTAAAATIGLAVPTSFTQDTPTTPAFVGGTVLAVSTTSAVAQPAVAQPPVTQVTQTAQHHLYQQGPQTSSPSDFHTDRRPVQPYIPQPAPHRVAFTERVTPSTPAFDSQDFDSFYAEDTLQQRQAENLGGPPLFIREPEEHESVSNVKAYLPRVDDNDSTTEEDEEADGGGNGYDVAEEGGSDMEEDEDYGVGFSQNPGSDHQDLDFDQNHDGRYASQHPNEPEIDEQSPDEDDRQARLALAGNNEHSEQREIDEQSPDEDDRQAQLALAGNSGHGGRRDVLNEHRKRNRANRPPSEASLHQAARRQLGHLSENDDTDADDEMDEEEVSTKRAPRGSKSAGTVKATTLQFYNGTWADAIDEAKKRYRYDIITRELFPLRSADLHIARRYLAAVIEEFKDEGRIFDSNFTHTRNMDVVVFQEASTYRGKLKTEARNVVNAEFHDLLTNSAVPVLEGNQQEHYDDIGLAVTKLLEESAFHLDGVDDQGRTNNLAHASIKQLCINFFYKSGDHAIARKQEEFKDIIPEHAVAVATTAIYCALDEYRTGDQVLKKFGRDNYRKTYLSTLTLIEQLKAHEYHKAKWDRNRKLWAHLGCAAMNPRDEPSVQPVRGRFD